MKNPVAKNAKAFNKAKVYKDRKKDQKRGYEKHKNRHKKTDRPVDFLMAIFQF